MNHIHLYLTVPIVDVVFAKDVDFHLPWFKINVDSIDTLVFNNKNFQFQFCHCHIRIDIYSMEFLNICLTHKSKIKCSF